jgi:hypothetical protein
MSAVAPDLWTLTWGNPYLEPYDLAAAVDAQAGDADDLDFRTRLLIRESVMALEQCWGRPRMLSWLWQARNHRQIEEIMRAGDPGEVGFPSLPARVIRGRERRWVMPRDPYAVFLECLPSDTNRAFWDMQVLLPELDKQCLTDRLLDTAAPLLAEPQMKKHAQDNWYVLFGEPLPERSPA